MEDDLLYTLFPLCDTLSKLYFALLEASSFYNKDEYLTFDINDKKNSEITRSKARFVFSEFDITGYAFNGEFSHFKQPLNYGIHLMENLEKIKKKLLEEKEETRKIGHCHCGTRISHQFEVRSRITNKNVYPVGRICIMKFADTDILEIMKQVGQLIIKHNCSKEKKRRQMELKAMRQEDKVIRKKKRVCNYDCCCKLIAHVNSQSLDPLLFDIRKINTKKYMNDYMKALGFTHSVTYV